MVICCLHCIFLCLLGKTDCLGVDQYHGGTEPQDCQPNSVASGSNGLHGNKQGSDYYHAEIFVIFLLWQNKRQCKDWINWLLEMTDKYIKKQKLIVSGRSLLCRDRRCQYDRLASRTRCNSVIKQLCKKFDVCFHFLFKKVSHDSQECKENICKHLWTWNIYCLCNVVILMTKW